MAIFRNININFWNDVKVVDDYTPEDRYFMLYALTNTYTNIIGCYEISIKQMSVDLGYTKDVVENLIKRFETKHKTILYDHNTKELFITNWSKYNWSASPKLDIPLRAAIEKIKSKKFYNMLANTYNTRETIKNDDTLYIPYRYPMDTTNSNSNSNSNRNSNSDIYVHSANRRERFEVLWSLYPRKEGKTNAFKKYEKICNKVDDETIKQGIERYIQYINNRNIESQYVKMGSTWFNGECWNDDYEKEKNDLPEWFDKEIEQKQISEEEKKELEDLFNDFDD